MAMKSVGGRAPLESRPLGQTAPVKTAVPRAKTDGVAPLVDPSAPLIASLSGGSRVDGGTTLTAQSAVFAMTAKTPNDKPSVTAGMLQAAKALRYVKTDDLSKTIALMPKQQKADGGALLKFAGTPAKLRAALDTLSETSGSTVRLVQALHQQRGGDVPQRTPLPDQVELLANLVGSASGMDGLERSAISTSADAWGPHVRLELSSVVQPTDVSDRIRSLTPSYFPADGRVVFTLQGQAVGQLVGPDFERLPRKSKDVKAIIDAFKAEALSGLEGKPFNEMKKSVHGLALSGFNIELPETTLAPFPEGALQLSRAASDKMVYITLDPASGALDLKTVDISKPFAHALVSTVDVPVVASQTNAERARRRLEERSGTPEAPRRTGSTEYWLHDIEVSGDDVKAKLSGRYTMDTVKDPAFLDFTMNNISTDLRNNLTEIALAGMKLHLDVDLERFPSGGDRTIDVSAYSAFTELQTAAKHIGQWGLSAAVVDQPGARFYSTFNPKGEGIEAAITLWTDPRVFRGDDALAADAAVAQVTKHAVAQLQKAGFGGFPLTLKVDWRSKTPTTADTAPAKVVATPSAWATTLLANVKTLTDFKKLSEDDKRELFDEAALPKGFSITGAVELDQVAQLGDTKLRDFAQAVIADLSGDGPEVDSDRVTVGPVHGEIVLITLPSKEIAGARVGLQQDVAFKEVDTDESHFETAADALEAGMDVGTENFQIRGLYDGDVTHVDEGEYWSYDH